MRGEDLRTRTRQFALDIVRLCLQLPRGDLTWIVRPQLIRAATGVASNYRAACRARSSREFAARLAVVVEEADESELWLDILIANGHGPSATIAPLQSEAVQLRAIMVRSRSTTLENIRKRKTNRQE